MVASADATYGDGEEANAEGAGTAPGEGEEAEEVGTAPGEEEEEDEAAGELLTVVMEVLGDEERPFMVVVIWFAGFPSTRFSTFVAEEGEGGEEEVLLPSSEIIKPTKHKKAPTKK